MDHPTPPHTPLAEAMVYEHQPMVTRKGVPLDPPDKGSGFSRTMSVLLAVLFAGMVIFWQNAPEDLQRTLTKAPPAKVVELTELDPAPGAFTPTDIMARIYIKMRYMIFQTQPSAADDIMINIDPTVVTYEDHVRATILGAEFEGSDGGNNRLNALEDIMLNDAGEADELPEETSPFIDRDIRVLRTIYVGAGDALDQQDRVYIEARYGKLGKIALTFGLDDDDPARKPLISGMAPLVILGIVMLLIILVVPIVGLVLLTMGIVFKASGKLKFAAHQPTSGGSVFLETYALFVGVFLVYLLLARYIVDREDLLATYGVFLLPAQWMLLAIPFWGLIRGMNFTRWRHAIGMYSGKGVFREIGCGILGYIATVPLFFIGVLITFILIVIWEAIKPQFGITPDDSAMPTNPIFDMVANGDTFTIIMLFSLATIWAPLCEELIFRGALFRHFRGYVHWSVAAMVTAILFAFMHSYGPLFVTPLIVLGFMFAVMRQWRGSLIAPMTAHFIHNFSVLSLTIFLVFTLMD